MVVGVMGVVVAVAEVVGAVRDNKGVIGRKGRLAIGGRSAMKFVWPWRSFGAFKRYIDRYI